MSDGPVGEGVRIVGGVVDALKREPLSLALVLMNVCLLAFFYVIMTTVAEQRKREVDLMYKDQEKIREVLSHCIVPDRRGEMRLQSDTSSPLLFTMPP